MELNDYQLQASGTAVYDYGARQMLADGIDTGDFLCLSYCAMKLNGEAGEVAETVAKAIRDFKAWPIVDAERKKDLLKELGDVLWYVAALARELGFTLDEVANANLTKLRDRQERGVLHGSGNDR